MNPGKLAPKNPLLVSIWGTQGRESFTVAIVLKYKLKIW